MRIHDLLTENRLDEKPMGFLKTIGNKAMAAFGSGKAAGKLETGTMANQLRKEYDTYLGKSGEEATADNLLAFLKSKNLPTDGAARALKAQAPQGAVAGAVKGLAKGVADIGKAAVAGAKAATAEPAAKQPVGRPQGGGKVPGQVSQTPGAQAKRTKRAAAATQKKADADRFNKAVVQPLTKKESLEEALSSGHIDAAIMAVAQDAAKQGISLPAGGASGGMTNKLGAVGAAAKAVGGATVDAAKAFNANFQAAYKGQKTAADDGTDGEETAGFNAGLKDESGVIPEDLMKRLNTLKSKQRRDLLKLLG